MHCQSAISLQFLSKIISVFYVAQLSCGVFVCYVWWVLCKVHCVFPPLNWVKQIPSIRQSVSQSPALPPTYTAHTTCTSQGRALLWSIPSAPPHQDKFVRFPPGCSHKCKRFSLANADSALPTELLLLTFSPFTLHDVLLLYNQHFYLTHALPLCTRFFCFIHSPFLRAALLHA